MKKKTGRPTKMTEATLNKLQHAFAWGCTDAEACLFADISKQCLYNYQDKHPEFIDRKEALKQRPILLARKSVIDGLESDPGLALKYLERKKKDEFSLKQIIDVKSDREQFTIEQLIQQVRALLAEADPEQLKELGITHLEIEDLLAETAPPLQIEHSQADELKNQG